MNNYRDYYNYANNNYNLPLYNQDKSYHKLYEPYQGLIRGNMFPDLYNTSACLYDIGFSAFSEYSFVFFFTPTLC